MEYTRFAVKDCKEVLTKAFEKAKSQNEFVKVRTNGDNNHITPIEGEIIEGSITDISNIMFGIDCSRYDFIWHIDFDNPEAWIEIESKWLEEEKHESNKNFRIRLEKRVEALEKIVFALNTQNVTTEQPKEVKNEKCKYYDLCIFRTSV